MTLSKLNIMGSLEVKLACTPKDIRLVQKLRYEVFYNEMQAKPTILMKFFRRDFDDYDLICDHLMVIDNKNKLKPETVGTYRILRQQNLEAGNSFYSAREFNIEPLIEKHKKLRFLELGRSCILKEYRNKGTLELLWAAIWAYAQHHQIDVMFGCASFPTTDCESIKEHLAFLHHYARTENQWAVKALNSNALSVNLIEVDKINVKQTMRDLPPLIKAYLRLGAKFGEGAVIDKQFGTIDVLVVLPVSFIEEKYIKRFSITKSILDS